MPDWLAPCARDVPAAKLRACRYPAWNPSPSRRCATPWPGLAADGPLMLHFHEAVGHDGAGRIEAAIAYAGHLEPSGE